MRYGISLTVRSVPGSLASKFSFRHVPELDSYRVDVARDDILQNLVSREDQLTTGSTPWRGPREKSVFLMQMLIEACSSPWDIILDCTALLQSCFWDVLREWKMIESGGSLLGYVKCDEL